MLADYESSTPNPNPNPNQVLADYESATLNLADPATFRDLSRPMGAQLEAQRQLVQQNYDECNDPYIPKFHYGSHFSTMG